MKSNSNNSGKKAKKAVHSHERVMHPGKPLTKITFGKEKRGAKNK